MRTCEMCGTDMASGQSRCLGCGGIVSDPPAGTDRLIGNATWGRIIVDLRSVGDSKIPFLSLIQATWKSFEERSAQRLYPGQADSVDFQAATMTLYGPLESFFRLKEALEASGYCPAPIVFDPVALDELYAIRDGSPMVTRHLDEPVPAVGNPV